MKSVHTSRSQRRHREERSPVPESDDPPREKRARRREERSPLPDTSDTAPEEKRPRLADPTEKETDNGHESGMERSLVLPEELDNPVITFAKCLTDQQKSHLKQKMQSELADLMGGEKSTDGASRVVDDMFKEFLAEKMALIEAEKRKVSEGGEESDSENSSAGEADEDPDTTRGSFGSKSSKHKKHKKGKKKKKHKEKDKDKSKKHKHKNKDKDKEKSKKSKSMSDKDFFDRLDKLYEHATQDTLKIDRDIKDRDIKDRERRSEKHRKSKEKDRGGSPERDSRHSSSRREKSGSHSRSNSSKRDVTITSRDIVRRDSPRDVGTRDLQRDIVMRDLPRDTRDIVRREDVPLVERGVKHKIHLDGEDQFVADTTGIAEMEGTEDDKTRKKHHHKHKDKKREGSREKSKERTVKIKDSKETKKEVKEAKVKLEHLGDDDEETLEQKDEKVNSDSVIVAEGVGENTDKAEDAPKAEAGPETEDDFRLPQRKQEEDVTSSVFERGISLKMPTMKPLEKYKELKKLGTKVVEKPAEEKKSEPGDKGVEDKAEKPAVVDKTGAKVEISVGKRGSASKEAEKRSSSKEKDNSSGKKKGLPDMRLISVLPKKRRVEVDEHKTVGGGKVPVEESSAKQDADEDRKVENAGSSLVISVNSEGRVRWSDEDREALGEGGGSSTPKLDDIPLPVVQPSPTTPTAQPVTTTSGSETEEGGKKAPSGGGGMKLKLGSIKISQTSAALIQSGLKFDTKKQALLEEGELSGESEGEEGKAADQKQDGGASSSSSEAAADDVTDGEITSSGDEKKKKDKKKHKHKKKKKHKEKDKKGKRTRSRSRSPRKRSSRRSSRSRSPSFDKKRGVWKDRSRSPRDKPWGRSRSPVRRRSRERSRSRDRDRFPGRPLVRDFGPPYRRRSRSPEFYRGGRPPFRPPFPPIYPRGRRSRSPPTTDLRLQIDKTKLREIAIANAYRNAKAGRGPDLNLKPDEIAAIKAGGKSIDELTDFCKKIQEKTKRRMLEGHESDSEEDVAALMRDSDEEDQPFIHHPFKVSERAEIVMNIRNARQLPVLTPGDKMAQASTLRLQFPVSSGSQHLLKEKEWVPVEKPTPGPSGTSTKPSGGEKAAPAPGGSGPLALPAPPTAPAAAPTPAPVSTEEKVFPDMANLQNVNIGQVVSERLSAMRKLQDNPNDSQAITEMYKSQQQMKMWAESKHLPGQFTGSTGVQILSQAQLAGKDPKKQAWAKKDTFTSARPLKEGIGMLLLQRMGWKAGEGLGKNKEGSKEPLMLDFKTDRRGLLAPEEQVKKRGGGGAAHMPATQKDLSGKHPVSALVELCNKRRWGAPHFTVINETGPDHKKNFLFKVRVNGVEYQPAGGATTKKTAKMQAAAVCLQNLGMIPWDAALPT